MANTYADLQIIGLFIQFASCIDKSGFIVLSLESHYDIILSSNKNFLIRNRIICKGNAQNVKVVNGFYLTYEIQRR